MLVWFNYINTTPYGIQMDLDHRPKCNAKYASFVGHIHARGIPLTCTLFSVYAFETALKFIKTFRRLSLIQYLSPYKGK